MRRMAVIVGEISVGCCGVWLGWSQSLGLRKLQTTDDTDSTEKGMPASQQIRVIRAIRGVLDSADQVRIVKDQGPPGGAAQGRFQSATYHSGVYTSIGFLCHLENRPG